MKVVEAAAAAESMIVAIVVVVLVLVVIVVVVSRQSRYSLPWQRSSNSRCQHLLLTVVYNSS